MYKKSDFLDEISSLRTGRTGRDRTSEKRWSIEYDLYSLGYRGPEISEGTEILCMAAGELQVPVETVNELLKRYEEATMSKVEEHPQMTDDEIRKELCSFLNLNNHKTVVKVGDKFIELPAYKNTPRVEYAYTPQPGKPAYAKTAMAVRVNNLPLPLRKINIVVSRETVRAVKEIEDRILDKKWSGKQSLREWLRETDQHIRPRIKHVSMRNIDKKWPELKTWMDDHVPSVSHHEFLDTLRRYIGRDDLWSPGPRIRNKKNEVVACDGLIQFISGGEHAYI
jgi:hypothetical protein